MKRILFTPMIVCAMIIPSLAGIKNVNQSSDMAGSENSESQSYAASNTGGTAPQDLTPTPSQGREDSKRPFGMGLTIGAVTIDNQVYTQIGIMPEIVIGKFGMALDLRLYIDGDGNIRKEDWDSFNDIIEKIYYIRWGLKGDPFYVRAGAVNNYRLGYGILMNRYANTIEYPSVIRTGFQLGVDTGNMVADVMMNDFKELGSKQGGLFAGRVGYRFLGKLEFGVSTVYDRNQYAVLRDADKDGYADILDDFPTNGNFVVDSDGDGVPDGSDPDRDGDGYTDNPENPAFFNDFDFDSLKLKPKPFQIQSAENRDQLAFAADIGYPFVQNKNFELIVYAQAAKFAYKNGWGYSAPGFLAKFAFINLYGEYRFQEERFIHEYFSTTYELERVTFIQDSSGNLQPVTKRQYLEAINTRLRGFVAGADFNIADIMIFGAEYQRLSGSSATQSLKFETFRANLDLNTDFVPKIHRAGAYYYQQNADKLFTKQEGTIIGYTLQYEISPGAYLVLDYRQTYRDVNGDGKISGSDETVKTTNLQTVFMF